MEYRRHKEDLSRHLNGKGIHDPNSEITTQRFTGVGKWDSVIFTKGRKDRSEKFSNGYYWIKYKAFINFIPVGSYLITTLHTPKWIS